MNSSLIFKINFLVMAIGITFYFIHVLNTRGISPKVLATIGVAPTNSQTTAKHEQYNWTWCETRVTGIVQADELKLNQVSNDWILEFQAASPKKVNFLSVEKWLSRFCTVAAFKPEHEPKTTFNASPFKPYLFIKFVNKKVEVIQKNDNGQFLWKGQIFDSPVFVSALEELKRL
jgi:hypothetical protein